MNDPILYANSAYKHPSDAARLSKPAAKRDGLQTSKMCGPKSGEKNTTHEYKKIENK